MAILAILNLLLVFSAVVCFVWGLQPDASAQALRQRMLSEMAPEDRPTFLGQLAVLLEPINRYLPTTWYLARLKSRLEAGGMRVSPIQFFVLQEMGMLTGALAYIVTMGAGHLNVGWLALFLVMGFFVPSFWLKNRTQNRRQSISRDLPELVDLLSLCVDAGMDFMNALTRVTKEFRRCATTEELGIALQEVRVGKRRRDALRAFSARVQTPETSSFSRTLIQADRMGTGISEALRILSEDMRVARYHWAERFAAQAPVKMLIPLLFSLASALIIVGGPILVQFLGGGFAVSSYSSSE